MAGLRQGTTRIRGPRNGVLIVDERKPKGAHSGVEGGACASVGRDVGERNVQEGEGQYGTITRPDGDTRLLEYNKHGDLDVTSKIRAICYELE